MFVCEYPKLALSMFSNESGGDCDVDTWHLGDIVTDFMFPGAREPVIGIVVWILKDSVGILWSS